MNHEQDLLSRIAQGDQKAFSVVYEQYYNGLLHYALKLTDNQQESEDITIQTFTKLYERAPGIENHLHLRRWLYQTVRNAALDYLRSNKRKQEHERYLENYYQQASLDAVMMEDEVVKLIYEAIETLPEQRKLIFRLSYIEGLKAKEIASLLNISENTVNTQKKRALVLLRKVLPAIWWYFFFHR